MERKTEKSAKQVMQIAKDDYRKKTHLRYWQLKYLFDHSVQKQCHLNPKQLTCMFVCQHNECAGDVSPPVETHHLCLHVSIGSLEQGTEEKTHH